MTAGDAAGGPEATLETPVLIVGAGPVGLSLALALSRAGVESILVERHPGTSIHPKARGVNVRTMEILRQWELAGAVEAAGISAADSGFFFRAPTLTAERFQRYGAGGQSAAVEAFSPESWLVIAQDALEPVLLDGVRRLGRTVVRFGHELTALQTESGAVQASVLDRDSGATMAIRARFLVGADGTGSPTRERLGLAMVGQGPVVRNASVLFRADLGERIADRRSAVYYLVDDEPIRPRGFPVSVGNPPPNGALLAINNRDRWVLVTPLDDGPLDGAPAAGREERGADHEGDDLAELDEARCMALVRSAVGIPDLPVEILSRIPWTPAARVAARYRVGSVFLAGDAAHETTPSGAFGLNVGIADAHNLGWKLGAVIKGWAGAGLLESYEPERRPVGQLAADESYRQFSGAGAPRPFGNWGLIFGATYDSGAIEPDGTPPPAIDDPAFDYVPMARPGHRAPHAVLDSPDGPISTLDRFGDRFTVLTRSTSWAAAAADVAKRAGIPLAVTRLAGDLAPADPAAFEGLYGLGDDGLVLVRPDGHVAWRVVAGAGEAFRGEAKARERLAVVLGRILHRPG